jgi:hypothetical protein
VALDVGVELGGEEGAAELVALQLRDVDPVCGEPAHRLVQRRRDVPYSEQKGCDHGSVVQRRFLRLPRQHQEPRGVVVFVLDILREHP